MALQQGRLAAQAAEADRLAAANSMRTALLAAVSHDLRTPLAGIKAASSALRSTDLDLTEADRAELVETVDASADRLTALVDNLLDMSRLQAGAVTPALSPSDLPDVVARAMSWLDADERERVAPGLVRRPAPRRRRPGLLERVVANLVSNAARHAPPRADRRVAAAPWTGEWSSGWPTGDRGSRSRTGNGCSSAFQRLGDSPSGQGVGLGLAVARGLTEAMGGTLTAEDTPGGGSRWSCRWPVPTPHATHGRRRSRRRRPMSRVLVIDDDPQLLRALRITLRAAGHDVDTAPDGRTALQQAAAVHPDVIVLDLGLPDLDGTEVLAGLRPWYPVPVLVLSARADSQDKVRGPRRRRRRLRDQALRHGRAAGPAARRCSARGPSEASRPRRRAPTTSPSTWPTVRSRWTARRCA